MKSRILQNGDWEQVQEMHASSGYNFQLPERFHIIDERVIEDNGKVTGYLLVRAIPESIMIVDFQNPVKTRARTLALMIEKGKKFCKAKNFFESHVFTEDPKFGDLLIKHHNFKDCKGRALNIQF